jgi:hypothetical protein
MHPTHKIRAIQQRRLSHHRQQTDAYDFFNLLTGDELFSVIESVLRIIANDSIRPRKRWRCFWRKR